MIVEIKGYIIKDNLILYIEYYANIILSLQESVVGNNINN